MISAEKQAMEKKPPIFVPDLKIEHPHPQYAISETYMIRKQSLSHSNDFIVRRLNRGFQRIKKWKNSGRERQLMMDYDPENCEIRRDFRRISELYNIGSKTKQIRDKKVQKMKSRIEKAKKQVNRDQIILARDVDISKLSFKQIKHSGSTQK